MARIKTIADRSPSLPLAGLRLLSPVANPGKVIAAPVNYQKHLDEVKGDAQINQGNVAHTLTIQKAGLFLKANSSLVGPGEGIALRHLDRRNDHEVELAVIIGKRASQVLKEEALDYVAGYSIGLDITIRGTEDRSFRKSPDSYTVLGPWLVTPDEVGNPDVLDLAICVNGEMRQNSNTRYMILKAAELIEMASSFYTLYPGDIISTGTPEGVSPIVPGDTVVASVEKVGTMEVKVRAFSTPLAEGKTI
jgi:2-keto-4-pentenoate hydratase/2-oxohepta-3-ene-1,7-dioic acid hydratase in catechol pathway